MSIAIAGCGSQQKAVSKTVSGPFIQQGFASGTQAEAVLKKKTEDVKKSKEAKEYLFRFLKKVHRKVIEKAQGQDGITLSNNEVEERERQFVEGLEIACGETPYQGAEPYWACSYKDGPEESWTVILELNKATGEFSFKERQKRQSELG